MEKEIPDKLKEIFDKYYQADLTIWKEFANYTVQKRVLKGEVIKDCYVTEKYINIVISGSVAHFIVSEEKEVCISLFYENQLFSDYLSFITQTATPIRTEALEDSEIWSISHRDLTYLYSKSKTGLIIGKSIAEAMFIAKQNEQINLLTLSPTERYIKMIKNRPQIFQRTSLKIISSYLGVSAESLSRIRKRISE